MKGPVQVVVRGQLRLFGVVVGVAVGPGTRLPHAVTRLRLVHSTRGKQKQNHQKVKKK